MTTVGSDLMQPSDDLEDRVVAQLYEAGLLRRDFSARESSMKAIHLRWALAATVLVAMGVWAGTMVPQTRENAATDTAATDTRPHFALMLYEDREYQAPAEGQHDKRVAEYNAWARELAGQGYLVGGAELSTSNGVLLHRDRPRIESVPSSSIGVLDGYFMIRASSLAEAERIAADCPHLAYGGTVSVRAAGA